MGRRLLCIQSTSALRQRHNSRDDLTATATSGLLQKNEQCAKKPGFHFHNGGRSVGWKGQLERSEALSSNEIAALRTTPERMVMLCYAVMRLLSGALASLTKSPQNSN